METHHPSPHFVYSATKHVLFDTFLLASLMMAKKACPGVLLLLFETRHTLILRETFSGIFADSRVHTAFQPIDSSCGYVSRRIECVPITRHVRSQHF